MKKILYTMFLFAVMAGCVYPNQQIQTLDDRPSLHIVGAPQDAVLYVDGLEIGPAKKYDGKPDVLLLNPGTHSIQIRQGNNVLRSLDVFLGDGTHREIKLSGTDKE